MKKVLILEDNEKTQVLLKKIFENLDIHSKMFITDSMQDALAIAVREFIDLFVVDIILDTSKSTDVSGITFVEKIRTIEHYKLTPVVFITGLEDPKLYAYSKLHCYSYLEKPFDFQEATHMFREILKSTKYREEQIENFYFRKNGILYSVETRKLVYIQIKAKKLFIYCTDDTIELPYIPLGEFTRDLDHHYFLPVNRSTVVNRRFISSVDAVNNYVTLKGGMGTLDLGRVIKTTFLERFKND